METGLKDLYTIESWKVSNLWSNSIRILYGGSVKPTNAVEIFNLPDVDGGLIGGASLNANDFSDIINSI